MKKSLFFTVISFAICSLANTSAESDVNALAHGTTNNEMLNNYRSFELGEAILLFMPDKNSDSTFSINWDYRSDSPILWMTDGYKTEEYGVSFRDGLMRINVQSVTSTVLRKKKEELAWTVRYITSNNPKFGVESIPLNPDNSDEECLGELYENCTFEIDKSLKAAHIKFKKICENEKIYGSPIGYELSHENKNTVFAEVTVAGGSGGSSSSFEMFFSKEAKDLCKSE